MNYWLTLIITPLVIIGIVAWFNRPYSARELEAMQKRKMEGNLCKTGFR